MLARHPYRDELLGRDWQIVGTQNQSGVVRVFFSSVSLRFTLCLATSRDFPS